MLNRGLLLYKSLANRIHGNLLAIVGMAAVLITAAMTPELPAQFSDPSNFAAGGFGSGGLNNDNPSKWTANYYSTGQDGIGVLEVDVALADAWHVYSVTQQDGGPKRTQISVRSPESVVITSDFTPDREPDRSESTVYEGITIEEHSDAVRWTAKIRLPAGFQEDVKLAIGGLTCKSGDGRCLLVEESIVANFAGMHPDSAPAPKMETASPVATKPVATKPVATDFRDGRYQLSWTALVDTASVEPGKIANIQIAAIPDDGFHIYQEATTNTNASTVFVVTQKSGLEVGAPTTDSVVKTETLSPTMPPVNYYVDKVTWSIPVRIPADAEPGQKMIEGQIAYMVCDDKSCRRPKGLKFTAFINVGGQDAASFPMELEPSSHDSVLELADSTDWVDSVVAATSVANSGAADPMAAKVNPSSTEMQTAETDAPHSDQADQEVAGASSFSFVLLSALIGGFILNFMPCVLPVIGLKVMSFVGQSGGDRKRIFALNLAYVGGICFVFAILAFLAIAFSFSWGQQFQYFSVRLGVTIGLFAFALSYFNVWEIPVPGMAAGKTSQELQSKEGFSGAFSKGIFTTLLATPCSGPLLGGVFGATLGMTSPQIMLVFATLALGMSLPYLAIGIQPGLVKFLPKPGPWMETFKQLMAFLFLAAVSYFFYQFADENKFPVFVTLMGVWFGCWIIGQVPNWEAIQKRLIAWVVGVGVAAAIGMMAFTTLKAPPVLQWVDYDEQSLAAYQADGKTVLVDFSAKWCVNCLVNLETAIDTEATRKLVEKNNVITMYADWTNSNPEITAKLEELNSNSIPVLAIYPAGKPNQPIVLRDLVSQNTVLEALEKAGPSQSGLKVGRMEQSDIRH